MRLFGAFDAEAGAATLVTLTLASLLWTLAPFAPVPFWAARAPRSPGARRPFSFGK